MCMKESFASHLFFLILSEGNILIFWFKILASSGITFSVSLSKYSLIYKKNGCFLLKNSQVVLLEELHVLFINSQLSNADIIIPTL